MTPRAFEGQSRNEKAPRGLSRPGCRSCVRPCSRWCRVHPLSACRAAIGALGRRTSAQAETNITTVETRRLQLVPTKDNASDMLTKALDEHTFARHRDTIMNRKISES